MNFFLPREQASTVPKMDAPTKARAELHLDDLKALKAANPLAASLTTAAFFERSAIGGLATMKGILEEMGNQVHNEEKRANWKRMTHGFCNLFDRYLKTRYETVQWYFSFFPDQH